MADWIGAWLVKKVDGVRLVEQRDSRFVFERSGRLTSTYAITSSRVDQQQVLSALATHPDTTFIVNSTKEAFYEGGALNLCEGRNVGIGDLGELISFLGTRDHIQRDARFLLRGLRQHRQVEEVSRLNNKMFLVTRRRDRCKFKVLNLDDYIVTAESVRHAIDTFGQPRVIVSTNPNRTITQSAISAAESAGVSVLTWGELLKEIPRWT